MAKGPRMLMECPDCGAALTVDVAIDSISARARSTEHDHLQDVQQYVQDRTAALPRRDSPSAPMALTQPTLPTLPDTFGKAAKASPWKIAVAICHSCLETESDLPSAREVFKSRCAEQGVDYGAPGSSVDRRPLHARVFDYVLSVRAGREAAVTRRRAKGSA